MPTMVIAEPRRKATRKATSKPARRRAKNTVSVVKWDRDRQCWSEVQDGLPTAQAARDWLKAHKQRECDRTQHWCRGDTYRLYRVKEATA